MPPLRNRSLRSLDNIELLILHQLPSKQNNHKKHTHSPSTFRKDFKL